ncbi:hypothetical protein H8S90_25545 [Olivibacter sp. SDN3]|uniref:hypothetical protein n=1 Tax=Olivibacter sp. SDN3 TaxID=2764720 RepID=UPI001651A836|nr:hypothetical protein [Olivibacter sp. SDN3]QNL50008.1 hypothetical protein H8S90_25545 [Olivibacter sp. SDN3]
MILKGGIVMVFLLGSCFVLQAQKVAIPFGGAYDENQILHVGFFFNYQTSYYKVRKSSGWQNADGGIPGRRLVGISTPTAMGGLGFGIPVDVRLGGNTNFIFRPSYIIFANQPLNYQFREGSSTYTVSKYHKEEMEREGGNDELDRNFFVFDMPVLLKFKSDMKQLYGEDKYRGYVVGGFKFTRNIGRNKYYNRLIDTPNPADRMPLIVQPSYFSYEAGVGADFFFEYFKMSTELKWSQSMHSILDKNFSGRSNPFMDPIDKLLLRSIQFSLIFE